MDIEFPEGYEAYRQAIAEWLKKQNALREQEILQELMDHARPTR